MIAESIYGSTLWITPDHARLARTGPSILIISGTFLFSELSPHTLKINFDVLEKSPML